MKSDLPDGVKEVSWDSWSSYPNLLTERQHKEAGLVPNGSPVGAVWYTTRKIYPDGHWLMLYDKTLASPKVVDEKRKAAQERARETAKRNRTCVFCGRDQGSKIKSPDHLCYTCRNQRSLIQQARDWLACNVLILDTETTGLYPGRSEIIQIGVIDCAGNILLDTYVKPQTPIEEVAGQMEDSGEWYGERYSSTAFEINGITNALVADAPTMPELWPRLLDILANKTIVVYNADFDHGMLDGEQQRHSLPDLPAEWECAMLWYADWFGDYSYRHHSNRWQRLGEACANENVDSAAAAHTSAGDCFRTLGLIKAIAAKDMPIGATT